MNQEEELEKISNSLICFLLRRKPDNKDVCDIFNEWVHENNIIIRHSENTRWCFQNITESQKTRKPQFADEICAILEKERIQEVRK